MEGSVTLEYSTDGASTFLDATDFGASSALIKTQWVWPYLMPEEQESEADQSMTDSEICFKATARLHVDIILEAKQFDLTTTNGKALNRFINALRCAPLVRLYAGSGVAIYGYDEFNSATNTNYLVTHAAPRPEPISGGEAMGTRWQFTLKLKKETDITTA